MGSYMLTGTSRDFRVVQEHLSTTNGQPMLHCESSHDRKKR